MDVEPTEETKTTEPTETAETTEPTEPTETAETTETKEEVLDPIAIMEAKLQAINELAQTPEDELTDLVCYDETHARACTRMRRLT